MKPIVLDRDGVINIDSDTYIKSADEWIPIPGSIEAIASLSRAGFDVYIATNQSGIGRALFSQQDLDQMHDKLLNQVAQAGGKVKGIAFCPHVPEANCNCRKPKTGLLSQLESLFSCRLKDAFFVGDSVKDIQAAISFGCNPVLVRTGKGEESIAKLINLGITEHKVFDNLDNAAKYIIGASQHE